MKAEQPQPVEEQYTVLTAVGPIDYLVKSILAQKPEQFVTHGYQTLDDIEELIERLMSEKVIVAPVCQYRARGSSTPERPKVKLRIVLQLQYP